MKKIDPEKAELRKGTAYPSPYDAPCTKRERLRLGASAGLKSLGVNRLRLPPGVWSSQRHWHHKDEEFVMVLEGEVVLVTNSGEEVFRAGDMAAFKAGDPDGHHFQNRSTKDAILLEVGTNLGGDVAEYSEADLRHIASGYVHRDGTPYRSRTP